MSRLKLGKSIDSQLRKQGFQHDGTHSDLRSVIDSMELLGGLERLESAEAEVYIAPSHVVGIKGKGYESYIRYGVAREKYG